MQKLLLLTDKNGEKIIIGVESIIDCISCTMPNGKSYTKIRSIGAMVITNYVIENIEEIYKIYNS